MNKKIKLVKEIESCTHCKDLLPHHPRPIISFSPQSKIIIIGQAPGVKVHQSGVPWDDASGERLRQWLNVSAEQFYDNRIFGIIPMGFCYPGKGKSGDLPPRPECAQLWMDKVLKKLQNVELIILIGQYSQKYFLKKQLKSNLTNTVKSWKEYLPQYVVLPHPSPRNNIWLKKNDWFDKKVIPDLQKRIQDII